MAATAAPAQTGGAYRTRKIDWKQEILCRYKASYDAQEKHRTRWEEINRAYAGYVKHNPTRPGRANYHVHKIFPQIEAAVARYLLSYFQHDPFVTVSPSGAQYVEAAKAREEVLQFIYETCPNHVIETIRFMKLTQLHGFAFRMPTWRTQVGTVIRKLPVMDPYSGMQVGEAEERTQEVIYDGLWLRTFPAAQVFPYPNAVTFYDCPWVIVEEYIHISELLELADQNLYDKEAVNRMPLNGAGQEDSPFGRNSEIRGGSRLQPDNEMVRLLHCFERDAFYTLGNNVEMIRDVDNFFSHAKIPLVMGYQSVDPLALQPIGAAAPMMPAQKMLNHMVNSMIDHINAYRFPMFKYKPSQDLDPRMLMSAPGHKIPVKNMDDVDIIVPPEMKQDLIYFKAFLDAQIEETHGYYGTQKGFSDQRNTATSDTIFQSEGNKRIQADVMIFEQLSLLPEAELVSANIDQFLSRDVEVNVGGSNFVRRSPADIRGKFSFRVGGISEQMNRMVQQQQMINLHAIAEKTTQYVRMPSGALVPVPVYNAYEGLKSLMEPSYGKNAERVLYRPELFGVPLSNEVFSAYGLPSIPGMDRLPVNPHTGGVGMGQQALPAPQNQNRSIRERDIINSTTRPRPSVPAQV